MRKNTKGVLRPVGLVGYDASGAVTQRFGLQRAFPARLLLTGLDPAAAGTRVESALIVCQAIWTPRPPERPTSGSGGGRPLSAAWFRLTVEDHAITFTELGGMSSEIEQTEYLQTGPDGPKYGRFTGRAKPPTVTLKRSTDDRDLYLWSWHQEITEV